MTTQDNLYTLLSIEAWRESYEGGWTWNNWFRIEEDVFIDTGTSNRAMLKFMRRNDWLTDASKGRVSVEDDGYNIVILDKNTREPLLAFEPQWQQ